LIVMPLPVAVATALPYESAADIQSKFDDRCA
jgi:hypothetical protein